MTDRLVSKSMSAIKVVNLMLDASVWEAACVMTKANCGSVLIFDTSGQLRGIVTERDLMARVLAKALDPKSTTVAQIMTPNPQCIGPDTTVSEAILIMIERGFRHLPIKAINGKIIGVFSASDALPKEIDAAMTMAQFHQQVNDSVG
ncbi:MAG: CBS domain-containing protein [Limnohabitans sp.]|nr:CBS domain-containing protein [Limnohabitans sp.]